MRVCVFCGSSTGSDPVYLEAAQEVGRRFAAEGIELVYGGGRVGLMGAAADACLDAGGRVYGVIPRALHEREIAHQGLTDLHIVETMHERKTLMADRADAFVALPGGAGTLEEIAEQWTWTQLGVHTKPVGFLDVKGYWAPLREMVARMVAEGFLRPVHAELLMSSDDLGDLLRRFRDYRPPQKPKWAERVEV